MSAASAQTTANSGSITEGGGVSPLVIAIVAAAVLLAIFIWRKK